MVKQKSNCNSQRHDAVKNSNTTSKNYFEVLAESSDDNEAINDIVVIRNKN